MLILILFPHYNLSFQLPLGDCASHFGDYWYTGTAMRDDKENLIPSFPKPAPLSSSVSTHNPFHKAILTPAFFNFLL